MKKQTRLYNIILPIWLLLLFPQLLVFVIPGNLIVDCLVLLIALAALRHQGKGAVLKRLWWKFWLLGFAADAIGVLWMVLGLLPGWLWYDTPIGALWADTVGHISHNAFVHPAAFLWTLAGAALAGACIYFFDKKAMANCDQLTGREKRIIALTMAIVTAPWLFFIPVY